MNVFEPFENLPEAIKFVLPEGAVVVDPVHQWGESFRPGLVVALSALAAIANQPGPLQSGQVLGNHRLRYARVLSQSVDGEFAVAGEPLEDGPAGGVGESSEYIVCDVRHAITITGWLWIVKRNCLTTGDRRGQRGGRRVWGLPGKRVSGNRKLLTGRNGSR